MIFQEDWKKDRAWLTFNTEKQAMSCSYCLEIVKPTLDKNVNLKTHYVFISDEGCTSLRVESIKKHESSQSHKKAEKVIAAREEPEKSEAFNAVTLLNKNIEKRLGNLFLNVHAIAKNNRPFSDYLWMVELDRAKGIDVGTTYLNEEYAKIFCKFISLDILDGLIEEIERAKFVAVICDRSSDSSIVEQELFFIRYVTSNGEVRVRFLGIQSVEKGNAAGIIGAMRQKVGDIMDWDNFMEKAVGLGCDGAAVMIGKKAGVAALLLHEQPSLLVVHCYNHRLELALKDAAKSCQLYDKVIRTLLVALYNFYHNSPLNRSMLKRAFRSLESEDKMVLPTRVGGVRWVGHTVRAVSNFLKGYNAIRTHIEQISDTEGAERLTTAASHGKAKGLLPQLKNLSVMLFLHFLFDVLKVLESMASVFQKRTSLVSDIHLQMKTTVSILKKYETR